MSQTAVEQVLGRMITDERFRSFAAESLEAACLHEGYRLFPTELRLLSNLELQCIIELAGHLDPGLCRAGTTPDRGHGLALDKVKAIKD
ncbi:MAG: hypothetical protein EG822_14775 [Deltaproteobacteria bacterium]|nr:hypothetical protein [Deltaproteobacteria bacterium]TLN02086.1 MAG: hypothetical protein FDZ73_13345 [bacterium]